jgi:hypothetical protein
MPAGLAWFFTASIGNGVARGRREQLEVPTQAAHGQRLDSKGHVARRSQNALPDAGCDYRAAANRRDSCAEVKQTCVQGAQIAVRAAPFEADRRALRPFRGRHRADTV